MCVNIETARPGTPEEFTVEEIGSRYIRLRWSPGQQTVPVTDFLLQHKKSSTLSWHDKSTVMNTTVESPTTQTMLSDLSPVTNYDIRIFATNEIGHSLPTEPLAVLTLPEGR